VALEECVGMERATAPAVPWEMAGPQLCEAECCQLLAADPEGPRPCSTDWRPRRPCCCRVRRWKSLVGVVGLGFAVIVLLVPEGEPERSNSDPLVQLQQLIPGRFFLCSGTFSCGVQSFQTWRQEPASLAAQVDPSLREVPGIPATVFEPVAKHWQSSPPAFRGATVNLGTIAAFVKHLLTSDPFGTGYQVPYVAFQAKEEGHAKGEGQVVAITQKQLAFIVANVIMGNDITSGNGLSVAIDRCSARGAKAFVFSLLSLLAVLSQELGYGSQGSMLVAAAPRAKDDSWKDRLETNMVTQTRVVKELGLVQGDFMSGGLRGQAMTDIAGEVVGGGASLCSLANSQDESLVQFYGEVLAFAFFALPGKMLPVPWVLLGARRYMGDLTGESAAVGPLTNLCGHIAPNDWLNQNIPGALTQVVLNGEPQAVASSAFVAVASVCSGSGGGTCPNGMAVNNNCDSQRRHADADITNWYQAFEPTMYPAPVQQAVANVIQRVGTGPWGAGVWWGDSQQYFLTVLLATSLLGHSPPLDYYIYDHFCENPGNQCFVLGSEGCSQCIMQSKVHNVNWDRCGSAGVFDMLERFAGKPAKLLYLALRNVGSPPTQVFDTLTAWEPSTVELALPIERTSVVPEPQPQPAPAAFPGSSGAPMGLPYPVPVPVPSPAVAASPAVSAPGYQPVSQTPTAPGGHCLSLLHRRLCFPRFHLPHLR